MKQKTTPPILLDIMRNGWFLCQLKYTKRGWPEVIDGKTVEVHDLDDIKRFVETQRPSLRNTDYNITFAKQRV